jgi:hypothetical protein
MASPATSTFYPVVEDVLNKARSIINDTYNNGAGRILTDTNPATLSWLNLAIAHVQYQLANNGVQSCWRDNLILTPITPVEQTSPAVQVYVSINGYFDGTQTFAQPALPNDLIVPWDLYERPTGTAQAFVKMTQPKVALPSRYQGYNLRDWEWRGDAIWMVGSTVSQDLRLRYEAAIPDVLPTDDFDITTIPIRMGTEALAYRIAFLYEDALGDADKVAGREAKANETVQFLINNNVRRSQRVAIRRRGFRESFGHGPIDNGMGGLIS